MSRNTPSERSKRIVPKREYASIQASRVVFQVSVAVSVVEVAVCILLAVVLPFANLGLLGSVGSLFCAVMAFRLGRLGIAKAKMAAQMETVTPLTHANVAQLPATETLVRASEQPLQEQNNILLRAATSSLRTPAEQLLRAAGGPEDTIALPVTEDTVNPTSKAQAHVWKPAQTDQQAAQMQTMQQSVGIQRSQDAHEE